jgi:hypothetical protein
MSKFLIKTVEMFRVDTGEEAKQFIEAAKKDPRFSLVKSVDEIKTAKAKGEIVDEWHRVTLTKVYNEEKEPLEAYIEEAPDED